jgi:hypothetical protein
VAGFDGIETGTTRQTAESGECVGAGVVVWVSMVWVGVGAGVVVWVSMVWVGVGAGVVVWVSMKGSVIAALDGWLAGTTAPGYRQVGGFPEAGTVPRATSVGTRSVPAFPAVIRR